MMPNEIELDQRQNEGPPVVIMPSMNLAYFILFERHLTLAGYRIVMSLRFPRRGILFGRRIMALHLHQLDSVFRGKSTWATASRIWWFRLVVVRALKVRKIPLIWTCHELAAHENDPLAIAGRMARVLARKADRIVVHNRAMQERLAAFEPRCRSRIVVIPHGDLREFYEPFLAGLPPRSSDGGVVFASIGNLRPNKGCDAIVSAFRRLDRADARLILHGGCIDLAFRTRLEQLAGDDSRIELTFTSLSDAEVTAVHHRADIAVFAFRDCPTSGSVITAMALERAVIGPAIGHIRELVDDKSGWLFDPADFEGGLLGAMQNAAGHPDIVSRKGKSARKRIGRDDWAGIAREMAAVYGNAPMPTSVETSRSAEAVA